MGDESPECEMRSGPEGKEEGRIESDEINWG